MDVITVQLLTMSSLFVAMVACCLVPYFIVKKRASSSGFEAGDKYELGISLANCFSGGVFVATFFVGLLPHVREEFIDIFESSEYQTRFPVTEFVVFMGFFIALLIEHVTLVCQHKRKKCKKNNRRKVEGNGINSTAAKDSENSLKANADIEMNDAAITVGHQQFGSDDDDHSDDDVQVIGGNHHGHSHDITAIIEHEHGSGHSHHQNDSGIRFYMLVLSLSVHSIFEGMALGLQSHISDLINLFVGVIIHECLVAFAMGVSLSKIKPSLSIMVKFSVLFSVMIPVGQALGLLVGNEKSFAGQICGTVLQGIAAGTFIHVTFLEVIPAELYHKKHILIKILFIFFGFMLIVGCMFALGDEHSHSHNHPQPPNNNNRSQIHRHP